MSAGAYESEGDAIIEMDLLPPRWLDVQDEVTDALAEITTEGKKLELLCQKHVLPGFDDEAVKRKEEREIGRLNELIARKFHACQKAIKSIDVMVREGGANKGEETMAKNLKISLATRVGEASANYRKKQSSYLKSKRTNGRNN
jgi:syntaxin 16